MESKYCTYCKCDHPLTDEWWHFHKNNRFMCKLYYKDYHTKNKEKRNKQCKDYYHDNKDKVKEYRKRNKDSLARWHRERRTERFSKDVLFKLKCKLRTRLNMAIKGNFKSGSSIKDLGCSIEELKTYLESKFYPNPRTDEPMTWGNHSRYGWHIDHIKPLCSFDLTNREEFLKACHYTNLQPLWAEENYIKNKHIITQGVNI